MSQLAAVRYLTLRLRRAHAGRPSCSTQKVFIFRIEGLSLWVIVIVCSFKALLSRGGYKITRDSHLSKICGVVPGIWSPMCKHIYWGHPKGQILWRTLFLMQAELAAKCLARQGGKKPQTGLAQHPHLTVGTWELRCVVSGGTRPKGHFSQLPPTMQLKLVQGSGEQ